MKRKTANDIPLAPLMERVIEFTKEKFEGKYRFDGVTPYFTHLWKVACKAYFTVYSLKESTFIIALLHDILEDTDTTETELRSLGVPQYGINHIKLLTKEKGASYFSYLTQLKDNSVAKQIKIIDIIDNLTDSPSNGMKEKYTLALLYFAGVLSDAGRETLRRK